MNKFNLAAAFTTQVPSSPLSATTQIYSAWGKHDYLVVERRQRLPHLCLAMGTNDDYGVATEIISDPFNGQTISDNVYGNAIATSTANDILSTEDIVVGTVLAFILAFGYSFLNGQSSSTSFVSWPDQSRNKNDTFDTGSDEEDDKVFFNSDNWKEMSR